VENLPGDYNSASQLGELLQPLPELGLHLDVGHANLQVPHNATEEIPEAWGTRLRHVHLHDNKGVGWRRGECVTDRKDRPEAYPTCRCRRWRRCG
jgi:sugar phosphate isomerase/epimerase